MTLAQLFMKHISYFPGGSMAHHGKFCSGLAANGLRRTKAHKRFIDIKAAHSSSALTPLTLQQHWHRHGDRHYVCWNKNIGFTCTKRNEDYSSQRIQFPACDTETVTQSDIPFSCKHGQEKGKTCLRNSLLMKIFKGINSKLFQNSPFPYSLSKCNRDILDCRAEKTLQTVSKRRLCNKSDSQSENRRLENDEESTQRSSRFPDFFRDMDEPMVSGGHLTDPENIGKRQAGVNFDTLGSWNNRISMQIAMKESLKMGKLIPQIPLEKVGTASLIGRRKYNEDR